MLAQVLRYNCDDPKIPRAQLRGVQHSLFLQTGAHISALLPPAVSPRCLERWLLLEKPSLILKWTQAFGENCYVFQGHTNLSLPAPSYPDLCFCIFSSLSPFVRPLPCSKPVARSPYCYVLTPEHLQDVCFLIGVV